MLGQHISSKGNEVNLTNFIVIKKLFVLQTHKYIRSLMRHTSYYRMFTYEFCKIDAPLAIHLSRNVVFSWTLDCQKAYKFLKEKLITTHVLYGSNWNSPFHINIDSSNKILGVILN